MRKLADLKGKEAETVKLQCISGQRNGLQQLQELLELHHFLQYGLAIVDEHHVTARSSYKSHRHIGLPGDILALTAAQEASLKAWKAV